MSKKQAVKKTKRNHMDYLTKRAIEAEADRQFRFGFTTQQFVDNACIALNEEFGFGHDRILRFYEAFKRVSHEYAVAINDEADESKHDKLDPDNAPVTKQRREEQLQALFGKDYDPYEVRYGLAVEVSK